LHGGRGDNRDGLRRGRLIGRGWAIGDGERLPKHLRGRWRRRRLLRGAIGDRNIELPSGARLLGMMKRYPEFY